MTKRFPLPASRKRTVAKSTGTQSIERSLRILRELAVRGEFGWRLSDLAARCDIDKGTAHRVLNCLVRERFVQQRVGDKHYFPGPMLFELGLSMPGFSAFQQACDSRLRRFAAAHEAIAWVILRSGNEYVCSSRQGTLELRGLMVQLGTRRPLFTSVGGVAILQTLTAAETRDILADNEHQEIMQRGDARLDSLRRMRDRCREHGFGVNLGDVAPGVHAFSVPIRAGDGRAIGALCMCGTPEQFPESRVAEVQGLLRELVDEVEDDARQCLGQIMELGTASE
jgi:DNA-binding IclR family transcriptional regulator